MALLILEQALWHRPDRRAPQLIGRSPGFRDGWRADAEQMILAFGDRPGRLACPLAVFARPLGREYVAVVRVCDVPDLHVRAADAPLPGLALAFHFLVVKRADYERFLGDPFQLAEQLLPVWDVGAGLEALTLPAQPLPPRTVTQVQGVLRSVKAVALREDEEPPAPQVAITLENAQSPALLGGAQVLVDGGRLVFEREGGDLPLLAGLWTLLPDSTRCRLWPASFAFGNRLDFDAVVVPGYDPAEYEGYTNEEQAADYPQGSYELALQLAAEAGDQHDLDRVFARRNSGEVLRRTLLLLLAVVLIVGGGSWLNSPTEPPRPRTASTEQREQAALAAGMAAVADPWAALGLYQYGKVRWGRPARP
jgi:hypothetical protein